ncbi:MAG: alpha/beta fold hydrolase [Leptolyngbyaceae cyanobacterium SL_1_1]|nr:alpha/beta fold hydrolase [Leptolyngbyaceae cyanobacterium RM1_1_2]NJO10230.1 alpha/beta fold hydrolase [Leptolyngbyaceae cyanobacterium SL_1_1]
MALTEHKIQAGELSWFYREAMPVGESDKPPVLLLHGIVSQSYSWRSVMADLAKQGFHAIAPDWIGHGFSDKPDQRTFSYTPAAFLEGIEAFVQALELEHFNLVVQGYLGGSVGLKYALRHSSQIERLAILNMPLTAKAKLPWKIQQLGLPLLGEMATQDPLLVDRTLEGGGPYQIDDADLEIYRRPFLTSSAAGRALFVTVRNLQLKSVSAELATGCKDWPKPTLVAWGMSDPWLSAEDAKAFASQLSAGEFMALEQVGHYGQEDWADKVSAALLTFFKQMTL